MSPASAYGCGLLLYLRLEGHPHPELHGAQWFRGKAWVFAVESWSSAEALGAGPVGPQVPRHRPAGDAPSFAYGQMAPPPPPRLQHGKPRGMLFSVRAVPRR